MLDHSAFKVALIRKGLTQWRLADQLGISHTAMSECVRGVRAAPEGFQARIEDALKLKKGALEAPSPAKRRPAAKRVA